MADLKEIVSTVSHGKVILIGQSWGGILAVLYAASNQGEVEKLVLTSPGPVFPVNTNLLKTKAPDSFHLKAPYYSNGDGNRKAYTLRTKAIKYFATHFSIKIASEKEADDFCTLLNYEVNKSTVCDTAHILPMNAGGGYYSSIMTFNSLLKTDDRRGQIKKIQMPVLILKGQCDNQPWGYTNEYLTLLQNSRLAVIPGAGHFISVEQPAIYTETIRNFLLH